LRETLFDVVILFLYFKLCIFIIDMPVEISGIHNITISGRIASGATTLASHLAQHLDWELLDGGKLFRAFTKDHGYADERSDQFDLDYEEKIKHILRAKKHHIIQSHLAGFDAQDIEGVFKILVICEDETGEDKADIRIDRLANRDTFPVEQAKQEVMEREAQNLKKWRRLYAKDMPEWVYWDKKYYDLVVNTFTHNQEESFALVTEKLGIK
jgi:cytidylate kinase